MEEWIKDAAQDIYEGPWDTTYGKVAGIAKIIAAHAPQPAKSDDEIERDMIESAAAASPQPQNALEVLRGLRNEVHGMLGIVNMVDLVSDIGWTNIRCIENRLKESDELLAGAASPHMTAQQFYDQVWIKEHGSDVRGDWPIRFAEEYARKR